MREELKKKAIYGMCMTSRHDFGLLNWERRQAIASDMEQLWHHNVEPYIAEILKTDQSRQLLEQARDALQALAILEIPQKPKGNAGLYSVRHDAIEWSSKTIQAITAYLGGK